VTDYSEHIGNTFGPKGFAIGSSLPASSSKTAQIVLHEGDEPDALADLRDADVRFRKHRD
jgi:hypothetical protein